jgi:hypothetical protein
MIIYLFYPFYLYFTFQAFDLFIVFVFPLNATIPVLIFLLTLSFVNLLNLNFS